MWRRFRCVCALGLAIGLLLSGCQPQPLTKSAYALDTYCAVTLQGGREATLDSAMGLLTYYDNLFSATRQGSDIYRLNHAQGQPVAVNQETYELLAFCIQMHALSDGAFDITLYPVSQLWDFKSGAAALPDQQDIARALTRRGMDQIHLLPDGQVQLSGGAQIDLGGVAKGYIGMRMAEQIGQDRSVASGVLDLGGNIQCLGEKADGAPFVVDVYKRQGRGYPSRVWEGRLLGVPDSIDARALPRAGDALILIRGHGGLAGAAASPSAACAERRALSAHNHHARRPGLLRHSNLRRQGFCYAAGVSAALGVLQWG